VGGAKWGDSTRKVAFFQPALRALNRADRVDVDGEFFAEFEEPARTGLR
jgi:hypothetical protein